MVRDGLPLLAAFHSIILSILHIHALSGCFPSAAAGGHFVVVLLLWSLALSLVGKSLRVVSRSVAGLFMGIGLYVQYLHVFTYDRALQTAIHPSFVCLVVFPVQMGLECKCKVEL